MIFLFIKKKSFTTFDLVFHNENKCSIYGWEDITRLINDHMNEH